MDAVDRLKKVITYNQQIALKAIANKISGKSVTCIVVSKLASEYDITGSTVNMLLKLAEVAGIIETTSGGTNGTYIHVVSKEALNRILSW